MNYWINPFILAGTELERKDTLMARAARERNLFGVYYISQYANNADTLFRDNEDRQAFVTVLQESLKQYPCDLLAYCLIDAAAYHLIVQFRGGDISQFMASLNIRFALTTKRSGLFRDRFQSELLNTESDIDRVLSSIKKKSQDADEWNSFCRLDKVDGRTRALNLSLDHQPTSMTADHSCILSVQDLLNWLESLLKSEALTLDDVLADKDLRNDLIYKSRRMSCLTLKQLGDVFGGISESMVSKIIKQGVHRA